MNKINKLINWLKNRLINIFFWEISRNIFNHKSNLAQSNHNLRLNWNTVQRNRTESVLFSNQGIYNSNYTKWTILDCFLSTYSFTEAMSQGYCCFSSILCWSHHLVLFTYTQKAPLKIWRRFQTYFIREHWT